MKINRGVWASTPSAYRGTLADGQHAMLIYDRERGATCLATVEIVESVAPSECEHVHIEPVPDRPGDNTRRWHCRNCGATADVGPWWTSFDEKLSTFLSQHPPAGKEG